MTTVLVVPDGAKEVVREDWELEGRDAAYVDHVTDDLTGFLQGLAQCTVGRHTPRRRGIQYAAAHRSEAMSLEYWVTRLRG